MANTMPVGEICEDPDSSVPVGKCVFKFSLGPKKWFLQACNCPTGKKCFPPRDKGDDGEVATTECA
jgi:hypothetical protein